MRSQNRTLRIACTLAALVSIAAVRVSSNAAAQSSNVLRIGTNFFASGLNPFIQSQEPLPFTYTYPHLVLYNTPSNGFVGSYASSWSSSANHRTWTFHLQPGWKWSDGRPITATDAAWSFNTAVKFQTGAAAPIASYVEGIRSASATNQTTLVLHMSEPLASSILLSNLVLFSIVPEHIWSQYAVGNGHGLKSFANTPSPGHPFVSGGPFTIVSYTPDSSIIYARNPDWTGPKPHIDGYGEQNFTNTGALAAALENGSIDYANNGIEQNDLSVLKAHGITIQPSPGLEGVYLAINAYHSKSHRELGNPLVRKAFDYAIDRRAIDTVAFRGYAPPMGAPLAVPGTGTASGTKLPWADPAIKPTPFSLARANHLLNKAGYTMGPGHVRTADGHAMSYTVILETVLGGPGYRMFSIMQSDFAKIGVRLTVRPVDFDAALSAVQAGKYSQYDMLYDVDGGVVDPEYMLNAYTCGQLENQNDNGYCDKAYDRLWRLEDVSATTLQRLHLAWRMEKLFAQSDSYLPIVAPDSFNAWDKRFTGYVRGANGDYYWTSTQTLLSVHQSK